MTTTDLTETMRRATDGLSPGSSEEILRQALVGGERRRLRHRLAVVASSVAVLGVVASTVLLTTGGDEPGRGVPVTAATPPSASYAPGTRTEVPEGPVIATDRRIVDDAALAQLARELVDGAVTGLSVEHVTGSGVGQHQADTTKDGRLVSFKVGGAGALIAVGRWDGYHAVGFEELDELGDLGDLGQRVATTAKEACAGAYQSFPPIPCTEAPEGWYSVSRPNAGGEVAGAKELWVELYTDDGYVVRVQSFNTADEKQGPRIGDGTAIDEADSFAIARSPRWFTTS